MSITVSIGPKKKTYATIREAAEAAGIKYITFYERLKSGMTPAQAMSQPVRIYKQRDKKSRRQARR